MTNEHTPTTSQKMLAMLALTGIVVATSQAAPFAGTAAAHSGRTSPVSTTTVTQTVFELAADRSDRQLHIKRGYVACHQKQWLDEFIELAVAGEHESANAYLETGKCLPLRSGFAAASSDTSVCSNIVSFVRDGLELWTVAEAVER